ncbi:hypothetical protein G647_07844 [Cladophialophora carrionii CBS 160.54]|uniref:Uncharacterized protein n=1 Tax=Cladophialophora carrionii CBS 160.54 TaxID=1279043 RepID=V9D688_9EURO|nr:uncharacterized protein G647_07844 [Cladophialophora carrionii CBS 160.54]ETI21497.1 hypothetical protein G647_07844 [Cladophialophora carrionii CBS 160.54]
MQRVAVSGSIGTALFVSIGYRQTPRARCGQIAPRIFSLYMPTCTRGLLNNYMVEIAVFRPPLRVPSGCTKLSGSTLAGTSSSTRRS